jgi:hypothetical protein
MVEWAYQEGCATDSAKTREQECKIVYRFTEAYGR